MPVAEAKNETGNEPIVRVAGLVKAFGPLRVLDGVGFEVMRGQTVAIVGRSGSGKSTLLRCIAGLESIQGGTIEVCGHSVGRPGAAARAQLRRDVGMVFQSYNLFPHLTVERNITLALTLVKKRPKEEARRKAAEVLALVGLSRAAVRRPAAAGRHRALAGARAAGHAVRRGDLGARPRTHRRGPGRDGGSRAARHDHDHRHP
jgi:polar amino acid transport system ATP-binding protein